MKTTNPAWDGGEWSALPKLDSDLEADVCVIGLGGSGLSAIGALADRGWRVIGIDAGALAGGAAGSNGGFLLGGTARFYHETAALVGHDRARQLYLLTLDEIESICRSTPAAVRRNGSLRIAFSDAEQSDCDRQYAEMTADDLPVQRYSGAEGRGLLVPDDASFNPLLRSRLLARQLLARGVSLFEHSPAIDIQTAVVHTPAGRIHCRHTIVAVDGGLEKILPELSGQVRTARLQMLATEPLRTTRFTRPVYARFGYEYWQQTTEGRIVLGGFRDAGGDAEWTHSIEVSAPVQRRLEDFLRTHLDVDAAITHRWAASVGYTVNGLPIIAEVRPRVWAIGGYNGTGNIVGALCARAAVDLIATGRSDWAALLTLLLQ